MENITITIPAELADDIKKQIEDYEAKKPFPQIGGRYEWISADGKVFVSLWEGDEVGERRLAFNNAKL